MNRDCPLSNDPRFVGDPVDTYTGATVERQRDFRLAGNLPLQWWRHYDSSKANQRFSLGWGQTHDFDCCLRFDQDGIRYEAPLGNLAMFPPLGSDGQSVSQQGKTLLRIGLYRYQLAEHGSPIREFTFADPKSTGCLTAISQGSFRIGFDYDSNQRLSGIVDSLGTQIDIEWTENGLLQQLFVPELRGKQRRDLLKYQYDSHDNLVEVIDGFGGRPSLTYDRQHRLIRKTDRIGHAFEFSYDGHGRCIRTAGSDGVLDHRLDYLRPGELTQVTRGNGGVWQYQYQLGKLVAINDPLGGEQKFVYTDQGQLALELDSNGNAAKVIADKSGAIVGKVDSLGHFRATPVDPNAPDPLHHRVAQNAAEYEFGRLIDIHSIASKNPPVEAMPSEVNKRPASYFEQANLYSSNNLGFVVGRNWWPEPSSGRQFDATGDLIHQIDRHGRKRRWLYDANGNVTKYVDFDGGVWSYEFSSWNHLVRETNPLGSSTQMEYDSQENLTLFQDAGGTRSEYAYDLKDSLVEVRRHGQIRERYQRDAEGNLLAKFASDGRQLLSLEYGPGNLLMKRTLASGDEHTYAYDPNGRYLAANTKKDAVKFGYDALGNRIVDKCNGLGVEHYYRGWRQSGESIWLDKFKIEYKVDDDGTLVVIDPAGGKHRIHNSGNGTIERRFSNGTTETVTYDELGRCESKKVARSTNGNWRREYQWSGEGELRQARDSIRGTTSYAYDTAHRLSHRIQPNGQRDSYEFDLANNLVKQPGLSNVSLRSGNRLNTANDETFAYNDRNHISERTSHRGTIKYEYDSRDQLIRAELPTGVWEADYDAMGRRVRKTFNGQTTQYLWNTDQLAGEISPVGRLRLYVYADPLALTPMVFIEYESIEADPSTGKRYVVLSDQIGTPICIEDAAGKVVWQAKIEPFGEAKLSADNLIEFHFRFPGHYWDEDLQLNYNRFRFYDPRLGRYDQSDPIGIAGGTNIYTYSTNPLEKVDTRGLNGNEGCCANPNAPGAQCPPDGEQVPIPPAAGNPPPWDGKPTDYSHIVPPPPVAAGKPQKPTPRQVKEMKEANRKKNGGVLRDDVTGEILQDSKKSVKRSDKDPTSPTFDPPPPTNEAQIDHIKPESKGGTRDPKNLQIRSRKGNREKSDKDPSPPTSTPPTSTTSDDGE